MPCINSDDCSYPKICDQGACSLPAGYPMAEVAVTVEAMSAAVEDFKQCYVQDDCRVTHLHDYDLIYLRTAKFVILIQCVQIVLHH